MTTTEFFEKIKQNQSERYELLEKLYERLGKSQRVVNNVVRKMYSNQFVNVDNLPEELQWARSYNEKAIMNGHFKGATFAFYAEGWDSSTAPKQ